MTFNARIVPTSDMSFCISVQIAANKYRHYRIKKFFLPMKVSECLGENYTLKSLDDAIDTVREQVKKDFGQAVEINLIDATPPRYMNDGVLLPESFFSLKTLKALKQRETKSLVYQYAENASVFPDSIANFFDFLKLRLMGTPLYLINTFISKINRQLYRLYGLEQLYNEIVKSYEQVSLLEFTEYKSPKQEEFNKAVKGKFFLPSIVLRGSFQYKYGIALYMAIACGEDNLVSSIQTLSDELDRIEKLGILMGHFSMPRLTTTSNIVGNGKQSYVAFTFPIINIEKLDKLITTPDLEIVTSQDANNNASKKLKSLGITTVCAEGEAVGGVPYIDEIESTVTLELGGSTQLTDLIKEANDQYIDSYNNQQSLRKTLKSTAADKKD